MDEPVDDAAAQIFAGQFYSSLAFGLPLSKAFGQAVLQVALTLGDTSGAPRLHVADGIERISCSSFRGEELDDFLTTA
jgi:hypothetical protein